MTENAKMMEKTQNRGTALVNMDKANAMKRELDDNELEQVNGAEWCMADWGCVYLWWHKGICVLELPFDLSAPNDPAGKNTNTGKRMNPGQRPNPGQFR